MLTGSDLLAKVKELGLQANKLAEQLSISPSYLNYGKVYSMGQIL